MDNIEAIWDKGNDPILNDETLNTDFIKKSISASSTRITSKLLKAISLGVVFTSLSVFVFVYNIFFYLNNTAILVAIAGFILLSVISIIYLFTQAANIKKQDNSIDNLHNLLMSRIKFFNTQFQHVLHCLAASVVLLTITLNLTMENADGVFELRKVLLLSVYYIVVYFGLIYVFKKTNKIYIKRLRNALFNLEENSFNTIDAEEKKHKKVKRWFLAVVVILLCAGLVAAFVSGVL